MKKLFAAFKNAPKRSAGLLMLAAAVIIPAVLWAWGPERPLYTIENAAPHVTFNSITNNQRMGNETNFVRISATTSSLKPVRPTKSWSFITITPKAN